VRIRIDNEWQPQLQGIIASKLGVGAPIQKITKSAFARALELEVSGNLIACITSQDRYTFPVRRAAAPTLKTYSSLACSEQLILSISAMAALLTRRRQPLLFVPDLRPFITDCSR